MGVGFSFCRDYVGFSRDVNESNEEESCGKENECDGQWVSTLGFSGLGVGSGFHERTVILILLILDP